MLLTGWKFASAKQKHYPDNWGSDTLKFPSQWRVSCCCPLLGSWSPADGVVLSTLSRGWTVDNTMLTPTRPSEPLGKALLLLCMLDQLPRPQMTPLHQGTWRSFGITDTSLLVYWTHGPLSYERLAQARWSAMLLLQKRSCPSTPNEYTTGLCRRLSASASGRWQALWLTRTASSCTQVGPFGWERCLVTVILVYLYLVVCWRQVNGWEILCPNKRIKWLKYPRQEIARQLGINVPGLVVVQAW